MSSSQKDKLLFTPGPLTTSRGVKEAMLRDIGSRESEFIAIVTDVRRRLLALAHVSQESGFEAVLMQGSGTFAVEAVLSSMIRPEGKLVVVTNGAYGDRIISIADRLRIPVEAIRCDEREQPDVAKLQTVLANDGAITHVAAVHCETSTGMMNPVAEIGAIVKAHDRCYLVDAMSSFGGVSLDMASAGIDFLISSPNKCLQGVPGFAFVLARREALLASGGASRSVSLDLLAQWRGLEETGQFRFTPPTHAVLAFVQALDELDAEGGIPARAARFSENRSTLLAGMRTIGFDEYLDPVLQSHIITAFLLPAGIDLSQFHLALAERGFIIYPGKISNADTFRIGTIGHIFPADIQRLVNTIGKLTRSD